MKIENINHLNTINMFAQNKIIWFYITKQQFTYYSRIYLTQNYSLFLTQHQLHITKQQFTQHKTAKLKQTNKQIANATSPKKVTLNVINMCQSNPTWYNDQPDVHNQFGKLF